MQQNLIKHKKHDSEDNSEAEFLVISRREKSISHAAKWFRDAQIIAGIFVFLTRPLHNYTITLSRTRAARPLHYYIDYQEKKSCPKWLNSALHKWRHWSKWVTWLSWPIESHCRSAVANGCIYVIQRPIHYYISTYTPGELQKCLKSGSKISCCNNVIV